MASGVKVVGGSGPTDGEVGPPGGTGGVAVDGPASADDEREVTPRERAQETAQETRARRPVATRPTRRRRGGVALLAVLAVLGVAGTAGFGLAWAGLHARQTGEAQARASARSFLVDLTNFDAKTVDADFGAISGMATGNFATQAQRFFNSSIRQELQKALASSRGQIRELYVQSYGGGSASVYAVVDQLYVNNKITSPQTDVLRIVVNLGQVGGTWKVSDVTVLQGPSLASGTSSAPGTGAPATATGSTTPTSAAG